MSGLGLSNRALWEAVATLSSMAPRLLVLGGAATIRGAASAAWRDRGRF